MSNQPLVSVITASYASADYTQACINSVINQDYPNWEMWFVEDCSPDNTKEVVQPYLEKYPNIHYVRLDKNTGSPAHPRNIALEQANGQYIAFLDGDDMFMPQKLSKQVSFMQQKDCAISFTGMRTISPDEKQEGGYVAVPYSIDYPSYLKNTCIPFSSSMVDLEKTGTIRMDETVPRGRDDTALWISLLKEKKTAFGLNEDLMHFRRGHDSISRNVLEMAKGNWSVYSKFATDMNVVERGMYFLGYATNAVRKRFAFKSI